MDAFVLSIFDSLPQFIGITDGDLRFSFVNLAYAAFLGENRESLNGRPIGELWGEDLLTEALPYVRRALAGERTSFTKRIVTRIGERRVGKVELFPSPEGGYVTIIQDTGDYERIARDREALVRELDHRVNNILQVMHSIIALEILCGGEQERSLLNSLKSRVDAMGLSYEHIRSQEPLGGWSVDLILSRIGSCIGPGISAQSSASEDLKIDHEDLDAFIFVAMEMARWASMGDDTAILEARCVEEGLELSISSSSNQDLTMHAGAAGIALVESFGRSRGAGPLRGGTRLSIIFPGHCADEPHLSKMP